LNEPINAFIKLPKNLYFIGIGGTGMSALAFIAHEMGYRVSGSDIVENEAINRLRKKGIQVFIGHSRERISQQEAIVVSSAIPSNNEELAEARRLNLPVIHRGNLLAQLCSKKKSIAIAGTHGKTTTTSMISMVLEWANLDPTVVIGGELEDIGGNAKSGSGDFFVTETDESDGSFLYLKPYCGIVTNIEDDHIDHYGSFEKTRQAFVSFLKRIELDGFAIVCGDRPEIQEILVKEKFNTKILKYGLANPNVDFQAQILERKPHGFRFQVKTPSGIVGEFVLNIPGLHNVSNSVACIATTLELGIDQKFIKEALASFKGVKRRFQKVGEIDGVTILDDYAHHPTEMEAVIKTAMEQTHGKVVVVFQPHRFTRTKRLYKRMAQVLQNTHQVVLLPIYSAGEEPIEGISSELILKELLEAGYSKVQLIEDFQEATEYCMKIIEPGDILITMGAGDVWKVAFAICKESGKMLLEN